MYQDGGKSENQNPYPGGELPMALYDLYLFAVAAKHRYSSLHNVHYYGSMLGHDWSNRDSGCCRRPRDRSGQV